MKRGLFFRSATRPDSGASRALWDAALGRIDKFSAPDLATLAEDAAALGETLARFGQLAEAKTGHTRPVVVPRALEAQVDWTGRPAVWVSRATPPGISQPENGTELGAGVKLFHDCPRAEIALGQRSNRAAPMTAPYGLALDVMGFEGSFLSLVLDLPHAAVVGMTKAHVLRVDVAHKADRAVGIFVRLNLRCGPNTATMLREVPRDGSGSSVEFDLAYSDMDAERLEAAWIDVMFEDPAWLGIYIRDLTLIRSRRAEL